MRIQWNENHIDSLLKRIHFLPKIYHYTKLETALEYILPAMQLRTNSLHKMNDPKENQPWAFGGVNMDFKKWYPQTYSRETHISHQYKFGDDIKRSSQIICFVKDEPKKGFLNEIMWAHYSDIHRGVCLEIDLDKFVQENSEQLSDNYVFEPVTYGEHEIPTIRCDNRFSKEENINLIIRGQYKNLFLRKSIYWEHENEKRLVIFDNSQKHLSIKTSLIGIYLGLSMPYANRPLIDMYIDEEQTKIYDLYYEYKMLKVMERKKNDNRPLITRAFLSDQ